MHVDQLMDMLYIAKIRRLLELGTLVCIGDDVAPTGIVVIVGRRVSVSCSELHKREPEAFVVVVRYFNEGEVHPPPPVCLTKI